MTPDINSRRIEAPDSLDVINDLFHERGWTDGLPIVPPTEERVRAMLVKTGEQPSEVLGRMPPINGSATIEKVAINAVMAGCRPEHFPVVLAAVKAVCQTEYNLGGIQSTTGGAAPLIVVNGPVAKELNVNADAGVFGNGYRANATIGRALRLVMRNIGGAIPGQTDKSTLAHPAKYTFCIAENEDRSPWEPLHVEHGYGPQDSTVTLFATTALHQISEMSVTSGTEVLSTLCASLYHGGSFSHYIIGRNTPLLMVIGPEHAQEIAAEGLSKADVKQEIFRQARVPIGTLRGRAYWSGRTWPDWVDESDDDFLVPPVTTPDNIYLIVAGGDGRHSAWIPTWSTSRAVTVGVE